jgi:hypothetical protein
MTSGKVHQKTFCCKTSDTRYRDNTPLTYKQNLWLNAGKNRGFPVRFKKKRT